MESLEEEQRHIEESMARIPTTHSRLLRAGMLSASILSFIPIFNLVRQAPAENASASNVSPAPTAQPSFPSQRTPYQDPSGTGPSQTSPSQPAPVTRQLSSAGSSSQSRAAPSHTRTHAS